MEFVFVFLPLAVVAVRAARRFVSAAAGLGALTLASLVFYSIHEPWHLVILLTSVGVNSLIARGLATDQANGRRFWLIVGIAFNIILLGWFKYSRFLLKHLIGGAMLHEPPVAGLLPAAIPLAISFFTFQQIAYLVDIAQGRCERVSLLRHLLLVSFFPHLIAGPITQPKVFLPQLVDPQPTWDSISRGLFVFSIGLTKKVFLADPLVPFIDASFANPSGLTLGAAWLAVAAYTLLIYFDFSGYSDMAVGLALLFGLRLPWNFLSPYRAVSIGEFWRRWHVTLSQFLRDYLYIPLGGSRSGWVRTSTNLMITMTLGGLWHGAGWNFILWGVLHGAALVVYHLWRAAGRTLPAPLGWALTLTVVMLGWVLFRSPSLSRAVAMYSVMFSRGDPERLWWHTGPAVVAAYVAVGVFIALVCPNTRTLCEKFRPALPWMAFGAILMGIGAARVIGQQRATEFIYFAF